MKKSTQKMLAMLLAIGMLATLAACSGNTTTAQATTAPNESESSAASVATAVPTEAPTPEPKHYVIGISQPFMGHPIRQAATVLIDKWLVDHPNVEVIVTDGQLNAAKQIADIEDLMSKKVDILLVAAHQSPTLVGVLREVHEAGIPIIAFDRMLTDTSVQIGQVVNDDYEAGKSDAKMLGDALNGEGKIAILEGPAGNTVSALRQGGFMDELAANYPNIEVVSDQVANFQRVQAVDIFENILEANPDIKGVFCHNDEMALGVVKVLKDSGKMADVKVVGIDGQKDALESIMAGDLYATTRKIVEFPYALDMALDYLDNGVIPGNVYLESVPITKDNVADYYDPNAVF